MHRQSLAGGQQETNMPHIYSKCASLSPAAKDTRRIAAALTVAHCCWVLFFIFMMLLSTCGTYCSWFCYCYSFSCCALSSCYCQCQVYALLGWKVRCMEALLEVVPALETKQGQPRVAVVGQQRPLACHIVCYRHLIKGHCGSGNIVTDATLEFVHLLVAVLNGNGASPSASFLCMLEVRGCDD